MNRIIASFTSSERNIITVMLLLVAGGYGLLEWRGEQQSSMVFSAAPVAASEAGLSPGEILPEGMNVSGRIDINVADSKLLETLPGVGPSLAGAITRHRETHGPLRTMADLDAVPGIGPAMMAKLAPLVEFGGAAPSPPGGAPTQAAATLPVSPLAPQNSASPVQGGFPVNSIGPVAAGRPVQHGVVSSAGLININTAPAAELEKLKGIGPALAARIVQDRQHRGPFRSLKDLDRVKGIGPKIIGDNWGRIAVE